MLMDTGVHYQLEMVTVPYEQYASKRKQYGWRQKDPILFYTAGTLGVSLENALRHQSRGLEDPYEPVLQGCGDKVSHYINWKGYSVFRGQKYSYYQKHGQKFPNSRTKVARQVAEAVEDFIERRQYEEHDDEWRVGPGYIELKDLYLLELRHVATGCFQPILGVLRPTLHPSLNAHYLTL